MAGINTKYVSTGKPKATGSVFVAPTTATLPTDPTAELASGFTSLGYISEDGITNENSIESEDIKDWGGNTVMTVQTDKTDTFGMTLISALDDDVLKVVFGDTNVTTDGSTHVTTVKANASELTAHAFVIEMVMNGNIPKRIVIPNGKISEVGEISYVAGETVGYEITITALPDDQNNTHYEYIGSRQ